MSQTTYVARGRYRHYKGRDYEVLGEATHSESGEALVIYRALYGDFAVWVRPVAMFVEVVEDQGKRQPRFTWMGPADVRRLGPDRQDAARDLIFAQCRTLEQALYRFSFENGAPSEVCDALAVYRNADGGFGHALEPDLRTPDSSILATTTALQLLRAVGADAGNELVRGAVAFVLATYDPTARTWPLIPATANDAPHAPWWTYGPDHASWFGGYLVNPRAEVVAHLFHYAQTEAADLLAPLADSLRHDLESRTRPLDMNELLCTLRLAQTPEAPAALTQAALRKIQESIPATLATTAEQWESYSLQPLALAPSPRALLAPALADSIPANLDFRIEEQESGGAWSPTWSWGDLYPDQWLTARSDWQGILTLEALRQLDHWGRLAH